MKFCFNTKINPTLQVITILNILCLYFSKSFILTQQLNSPKLLKNQEKVEISFNRVKRFVDKSTSEEPVFMKLKAFDSNYHIKLFKPRSSIFSPNFKFQTLHVDLKKKRRTLRDVTPSAIELNSIEDGHLINKEDGAAISLNQKDGKIHGIVDDLVIVSSTDANKTVHVITKNNMANMSLQDALRLSDSPLSGQKIRKAMGRSMSGVSSSTANPEVLIVYDNKIHQKFNGDIKAMTDYTAVLFRGINHRYATIKSAKIKFYISGIRAMSSTSEQSFMEDHKISDGDGIGYDMAKTHSDYSNWVYSNLNNLPKHDITMFITSEDLMVFDKDKEGYNRNVNGRAWVEGACFLDHDKKMSKNVGVAEDLGLYTGLFTIVHELAHNLGAYHDGQDDAVACSWDQGHIMSYTGYGTKNKFRFSDCSISAIKNYIQSTAGNCLKVAPTSNEFPTPSKEIGKFTTMDAICRERTNKPNAVVDQTISENDACKNIVCTYIEGEYTYKTTMSIPAAEDMPCGNENGRCWEGECLDRLDRLFLKV